MYLYEMANLKVAKLCNHQKEASKLSSEQISKTDSKIKELQNKLTKLNRQKNNLKNQGKKITAVNKKITNTKKKIKDLKNKKNLQSESKNLAKGTSKINYIDPRITISFLKKVGLFDQIDKFFNKSQQEQFKWAIEVTDDFRW